MDSVAQKRTVGFSILGLFFVLIGAGLLLHRMHFLQSGWGMIFWICLGLAGAVSVVQAFITRNRGVVFWGSLLFFVSVVMLVPRFTELDIAPWNVPATFSLALGFSFLMLFVFDPRRIGVLIPVLLFGGYGVAYYLWWWDVIEWYDLRHYIRYWPVLVILWGMSLIFRTKT